MLNLNIPFLKCIEYNIILFKIEGLYLFITPIYHISDNVLCIETT